MTKSDVEAVVGPVDEWSEDISAWAFTPRKTITFAQVQEIADLAGTDAIDFDPGDRGGSSESGSWGYIPPTVRIYKYA